MIVNNPAGNSTDKSNVSVSTIPDSNLKLGLNSYTGCIKRQLYPDGVLTSHGFLSLIQCCLSVRSDFSRTHLGRIMLELHILCLLL